MTTIKRTTIFLLAGAALAAAGCGSDDEGAPIPAEQADALLRQLENVQNRLENGSVGACRDVFTHPDSPNQGPVEEILAQIPQRVDPEVRSALEESFARLWELVDEECDEREQESQPEETTPEPEPEPEPTPTETLPPEETTPPEEEPTPPDEETLPPEGDGDNGGGVPGNGNGIGNGNGGGGGVGPGASE